MIQFKADIDYAGIEKAVMERIRKVEEEAIDRLKDVGSQALELALSSEAYHNVTGNLRSSIGYGIFKDGEEVFSDGFFHISGTMGDGSLGVSQGRAALAELGSQTKGIALVLVAGSDHAVKVESEGKVVLSDASLLAESLVKKMFT